MSLVAVLNGDYRIDVRAFDKRAGAGSYEIELEEIRSAESRDKQYEADRQHSKDLANKLAEAVSKRADEEVLRRYEEGVQELAHPKAEPALLLVRATEATQLPLTYRARGDYQRAATLANKILDVTERNFGSNNRLFGSALVTTVQLALDLADNDRAAMLMVKARPFLDPRTTDIVTYLAFLQLQGKNADRTEAILCGGNIV